jgi:hypothetical protein
MSLFLESTIRNKKENTMQLDGLNVIHNIKENRFEVNLNSHTAKLNYHLSGDIIIFTHTGVPSILEGQGIGSELVKVGLEYAKKNNLKVQTLCWFVDGYLQRHMEYQELRK